MRSFAIAAVAPSFQSHDAQMIRSLIFVAAMAATPVVASPASLAEIVRRPSAYIDQTVTIRRIPCVDDAKGDILCLATASGKIIGIDAVAVGATTDAETAERLALECKGSANLASRSCLFDVTLVPKGVERGMMPTGSGEIEVEKLSAQEIDLAKPRR